MVSTGKIFENRIGRWHKKINCLTFKFPDYASSGNKQKSLCDIVTITSKGTYWLECKHTNNKVSFSYSLIKSHQWLSMLRIEELIDKAYFLIEDGNKNVYAVKPSILQVMSKKSIKFTKLSQFLVKKIETFIY